MIRFIGLILKKERNIKDHHPHLMELITLDLIMTKMNIFVKRAIIFLIDLKLSNDWEKAALAKYSNVMIINYKKLLL